MHVASLLGEQGAPAADVRTSYWRHATGGTFAPPDMELGEQLLRDLALVTDRAGLLVPSPSLLALIRGIPEEAMQWLFVRAIIEAHPVVQESVQIDKPVLEQAVAAAVPDAARREQILLALNRHFDDSHRKFVGEIGEQTVLTAVRAELEALGHHTLARAVRRVSLDSDQLGYDISAPRITGPTRLLEVKSTVVVAEPVTIHLTRPEIDAGVKYPGWALVVCHVLNLIERKGEIVGWCSAESLIPLLPVDPPTAAWELAAVKLPTTALIPGLPPTST